MVFWLHNASFHQLYQSSKKRILKVAIFSLSFELMKISFELVIICETIIETEPLKYLQLKEVVDRLNKRYKGT